MTREQVLAMSAQELAEATAVHVMEWRKLDPDVWIVDDEVRIRYRRSWNPAEDIRDAKALMDKLQESHLYMDIRTCSDFYEVWVTNWENDIQTQTEAHPMLERAITTCSLLAVVK